MKLLDTRLYRCAEIEVDPSQGCLKRHGQERYLRQKTFQVLLYLLEQRRRLVTKEELIAVIWKDAAVTDDALVQLVKEIRQALGDDPRRPRFIKTIPKGGYRFIGPVEEFTHDRSVAVEIEETTSVEIELEEELTDHALPDEVVSKALAPPAPKRWLDRRQMLAAATITMLLVASAFSFYLSRRSDQHLAEVRLPQVPGKKPVAVIYFENQAGDRELDWLREGLADMLITNLSRSKRLTVLSRRQLYVLLGRMGRRSTDQIRLEEALEMARHSQAEVVVMGSFARLGEKVRIDVQLHDGRAGQLLAAEHSVADRPDQILAQVDLLSLKVARHLGAPLEDQDRQTKLADVMTDNLEAYRYYSLALEKAQAYHSLEAIKLWEKAIALDPQFAMAYARIGYTHLFIRVGEGDQAKPYLAKAFQLSHRLTDKDKLYLTALSAQISDGNASAIRAFRDLIAQYPHEAEAYLPLGNLLRYTGRLAEASAVFEQGLVIDPEAKEIYNALGFAHSGLGRYAEAVAAHQHYVELAPSEPNAHDSLGMTYHEAGRYEEALAEFARALELDPEFHFAHLHLGDVYFRLGRYQAAIKQYQRYLEFAPSDWDRAFGYNRLALLYWKKGDLGRAGAAAEQEVKYRNNFGGALLIALARGDLRTAEKLKARLFGNAPHPQPAVALSPKQLAYCRGYYALKTGHATEAIEHFQAALRQPPLVWNVDGVEDCLAQAYLELGRPGEAIAEYERIVRLNPNWPLAHYHLGQAYERQGECEQARLAYERFLHLWKDADPDIPEVIEAKARLTE